MPLNINFPLYKIGSYLNIDTNPLGLVKITTIKRTYILDDTSLEGDYEERRVELSTKYGKKELYSLRGKVRYFRQLVKYSSGTTFIDIRGKVFKYTKSSKLFKVVSIKISSVKFYNNWSVIRLVGMELPFVVGFTIKETTKYASIMFSSWGPLLYDLTEELHKTYKRRI